MPPKRTTANARWHRGKNVPRSVVRRFAEQIVDQFQPDKIILFGSHAYGRPHADSDVDILVVMPTRNQLDQAVKIHLAIMPSFPVQIIVRTPKKLKSRLQEGDSFLREVITKGELLYEKVDQGMGDKSRSRPHRRQEREASRRFMTQCASIVSNLQRST